MAAAVAVAAAVAAAEAAARRRRLPPPPAPPKALRFHAPQEARPVRGPPLSPPPPSPSPSPSIAPSALSGPPPPGAVLRQGRVARASGKAGPGVRRLEFGELGWGKGRKCGKDFSSSTVSFGRPLQGRTTARDCVPYPSPLEQCEGRGGTRTGRSGGGEARKDLAHHAGEGAGRSGLEGCVARTELIARATVASLRV